MGLLSPATTGWAAPMLVEGAIAAMCPASVMNTPAEPAREPDGATKTATGTLAFMMRLTMARVDSRSPPGVSSMMTRQTAPSASDRSIASVMYCWVAGLIIRREDVGKYPIRRLDDMIGHQMRLGHTEGAYRGEMFKQFLSQHEAQNLVFNVNLTSHGIQMLVNDRIDALVEVPTAAMAQAELMGVSDALVAHPLILLSEPVHFMFSKLTVSPMLVEKINVEIDKAIQTTTYRALYGVEALSESSGS